MRTLPLAVLVISLIPVLYSVVSRPGTMEVPLDLRDAVGDQASEGNRAGSVESLVAQARRQREAQADASAQRKEESARHAGADSALAAYDRAVAEMKAEFERTPADPRDKEWVKKKLAHMARLDNHALKYKYPFKFDAEETRYFEKSLGSRTDEVFRDNVRDLKALLEVYPWFRKSEFGEQASADAFVVVQHANFVGDLELQEAALKKMEKLYPADEVSRKNYAFLHDRVALQRKRPQRFGTQGYCTGPGVWEPVPIEEPSDPASVAARRKEMGIEPASLEEYKAIFKDICR